MTSLPPSADDHVVAGRAVEPVVAGRAGDRRAPCRRTWRAATASDSVAVADGPPLRDAVWPGEDDRGRRPGGVVAVTVTAYVPALA